MVFQVVYCDLISNLAFFTIAVVSQQLLQSYFFTDLGHEVNLTVSISVLFLNIVVTSIMHILVMLVGKFCMELDTKVKTQSSLLNKIKEGIIIVGLENKDEILYANQAAQNHL